MSINTSGQLWVEDQGGEMMKFRKIIFAAMLIYIPNAYATSCIATSDIITSSAAILIGRVERIKRDSAGEAQITLSEVQSLKGIHTYLIYQPPIFEPLYPEPLVGKKYKFYLSEDAKKRLVLGPCSKVLPLFVNTRKVHDVEMQQIRISDPDADFDGEVLQVISKAPDYPTQNSISHQLKVRVLRARKGAKEGEIVLVNIRKRGGHDATNFQLGDNISFAVKQMKSDLVWKEYSN